MDNCTAVFDALSISRTEDSMLWLTTFNTNVKFNICRRQIYTVAKNNNNKKSDQLKSLQQLPFYVLDLPELTKCIISLKNKAF